MEILNDYQKFNNALKTYQHAAALVANVLVSTLAYYSAANERCEGEPDVQCI